MNASFATNTFSTAQPPSVVPLKHDPCSNDRCWTEENGNNAGSSKTSSWRRRTTTITSKATTRTPTTPLQRRAARQRVLKEWLTPEMIQRAFVPVYRPQSLPDKQPKRIQHEQLIVASKPPTPKQQQGEPKRQWQPQQASPVIEWLTRCANSSMATTCVIPSTAATTTSFSTTKHSSSTTTSTTTSSSNSTSTTSTVVVPHPGLAVVSTPQRTRAGRQQHGRWPRQRQCSTGTITPTMTPLSTTATRRQQKQRWLPVSAKAQRLRHEMILSGEFIIPVQQQQQQQSLPWLPILSPGGLCSTSANNLAAVEIEPSKLRQKQPQQQAPRTTTLSNTKRFHKDQRSRETMAEIEAHRQHFRALRPQRRRIQFVGSALADVDDDALTLASSSCCHVASLSLQDLNMPLGRNHHNSWSALDHSYMRSPTMPSRNDIASVDLLVSQEQKHGDDNDECSGGGPMTVMSPRNLPILDGSPCRIRCAYEEKRRLALEQRKRQQRIHKLEMELDQCTAKAEYVEELVRNQDQPQYRALAKENQQLRRQLVTAARAAHYGGSHPQMVAQENSLRKELQQLTQELVVLDKQPQQQRRRQVDADTEKPLLTLAPIETSHHPAASVIATLPSSNNDCSTVLPFPNKLSAPPMTTNSKGKDSTTTEKVKRTPPPARPVLKKTAFPVPNNKSNNPDSTISPPAPIHGATPADVIALRGKSNVPPPKRQKKTRQASSGRRRKRKESPRSACLSSG